MHFIEDMSAIATALHSNSTLPTFLPQGLTKVERVGMTRNASRTPYVVYWVGERRCCTFFKRQLFFKLLKVLVAIAHTTINTVKCVETTEWGGLKIKAATAAWILARAQVNKFFYSYHQVIFEQVTLSLQSEHAMISDRSGRNYMITSHNNHDTCSCPDLYDSCSHRIAATLALLPLGFTTVTAYLASKNKNKTSVLEGNCINRTTAIAAR
ncbi:SWIM zinc finger family protein [Gloeocapsopsis crepidinum LEGE 06123]|uniref:SWIM zinc finger family protein n=1 Tax=Gloeocapsopsis crepidinum LEGE 06123 TaxID=588587 RepID=A0ABR9UYW3_9CHRO|nr:SWIM zinc finger family protein [Gloeocapsopsis crepidinum]MBE9193503.1 SWIM zinc finger family protein [Gloeocapsopsis crepidinum LEGE 06123]